MAWTISTDIEDAVWRAVERALPKRAYTGRTLRDAIVNRSRRYTSERDSLGIDMRAGSDDAADDADLAARALFFTIADAAKIFIPLAELDRQGLLSSAHRTVSPSTFTVADIGAGVGAMSLGLLDYLNRTGALARGAQPGVSVNIHAFDRDHRALGLMQTVVRDLADRWDARISISTHRVHLGGAEIAGLSSNMDLVIAGTVLNEMNSPDRIPTVTAMLDAIADHGAVILIEPALRDTSRALHELRDTCLRERLAHVFAPCTRRDAPCPALIEGDWCYEDRVTDAPGRLSKLSATTGLRAHGLKFAYTTLRRHEQPTVATSASPDGRIALRIVSHPKRTKGKRECLVCGQQGRVRLRMLRRNRGDYNRVFDKLRRGDIVLAPASLAHGGDIQKQDDIRTLVATIDEVV